MHFESPTAAFVARLRLKQNSALAVAASLKDLVAELDGTTGTRALASLARRIEACAMSFFSGWSRPATTRHGC